MAKRPRLLKPLIEKIINLNKQQKLFGDGDAVLLALSGGADSVFMLHAMLHLREQFNLRIAAAHVNHGLRGKASLADEKFCLELCKQSGITYHVKRIDIHSVAEKNKLSVEEAGRVERYKFFNSLAKRYRFTKIATAHNLDDNAESVFMAVSAGTGVSGLSGIAPKVQNVIRPILTISKEQITGYLHAEHIAYCTDESNNDILYQRNFFRHSVLPLIKQQINPNLSESVMRLSETLRGVKEFIDEQVLLHFFAIVKGKKGNCTVLIEKMEVIHPLLQAEIVKRLGLMYMQIAFSAAEIHAIIALMDKQKGKILQLSNKTIAEHNGDFLTIRQDVGIFDTIDADFDNLGTNQQSSRLIITEIDKKDIILGKTLLTEYIDADKVENRLILRKWKSGDNFYPLGMSGKQKVSDFLTGLKLSQAEKSEIEVVTDAENIVWVAGKRLDDRYKLTPITKKFLQLRYIDKYE